MLGFVDVILRVPPIFIIDEILKISMGLPFNASETESIGNATGPDVLPASDVVLLNASSSLSFSNNSSSLNEFNASQAMYAEAVVSTILDDSEFYKILSLTTLKFVSCILGECCAAQGTNRLRITDKLS